MLPCLCVNQSATISAQYLAIPHRAAPTIFLSERFGAQLNKALQLHKPAQEVFLDIWMTSNFLYQVKTSPKLSLKGKRGLLSLR